MIGRRNPGASTQWKPRAAGARGTRRVLVLGWSHKLPRLMAEFASYPNERFLVDVASTVPSGMREAAVDRYSESCTRLQVRQQEADSILLNATACALIILGGLGFPVVYELWTLARRRAGERLRMSIQAKVVLLTSGILILGGMGVFLATSGAAMGGERTGERVLASLFQSVTCRTAGFNTVEIGSLNATVLAFMIFLMFFGASPGSCGGGVKTTTLAVLTAFSWSRIKGRIRVNMFHKSVPYDTVTRCVIVTLLSVALIAAALFFLLWVQQGRGTHREVQGETFLAYLFEVVSAFGTVGLSMGASARLGVGGKIIIIVMMLIGRVGVPAFTYVIAGTEARSGLEYAEENLMIG